ncbi:MAG TPA: hypothetical protein VLM85_03395 [Polyangiaceae bacterium]|nr:hypothetical protein [Polyangiaceae bacterium]
MAPLDHVRDVRAVTRYEPFFSWWLVFAGGIAGGGAAAAFSSTVDRDTNLAVGTALTIASAAAILTGVALLLAPSRTTTLYTWRAAE